MIKKKKKLRTKRNKQFIKQFINELEKKKNNNRKTQIYLIFVT